MYAKPKALVANSDKVLRQSLTHLSGLVDLAPDAIIGLDASQRIFLFNAAAERMFHCSAMVAIGQLIDRFIPDWMQSLRQEHSRALGEADATNHSVGTPETLTAHRADGGNFLIEASASHAEVAGTEIYTLVLRVTTDRMRSQMLQRVLLDAVPSSVLLLDHDMQVVLANRNFLEKAKRSESNTIGSKLAEVFPKVILDEMGLEQRIRQVFQENKATRGRRLTYRAPGVALRIYYYSIIPVSWGARVESVMLLMDDITEQVRLGEEIQRIELHLASVVECASDIVLSTDMHGRILTWNRAAERISGYSFDEVKNRLFYEYCAVDVATKAFFTGGRIYQKGSNIAEYNLATKQGSSVRVSWVFSPMKDDMGQPVGIVAVGRDLTEQRRLETQLIRSQKLAALGVMAGGIAHEIRNPLAVSSSAAQFLMEEDITPEFRRDCAEKVHVGIQKASLIIENLLKFSSPSASMDKEQVDLLTILNEGLTIVANQAKIQRVEVKSILPRGPILILGIAGLLEQALMNLFLNALEAMPNGGTLGITVEKTHAEVLVHVADTGHGIPSANIGKIFDPFYTTSQLGKGIGLGLSICHSIVEQHFGSIDVTSVEGKGSTLTIRLPLL